LSSFTQMWVFSTDFHVGPHYQISQKSVQWKPRWCMQTEGTTDGQTDLKNVISYLGVYADGLRITFCLHSVFFYSVWISEQTAIIFLYSINWLVFIIETECVYCAVRIGYLYVIQVNLAIQICYQIYFFSNLHTANWSCFQKGLSYSDKLKAESVRAVMFNTKSFLIQSFWQKANEQECIAGRGVGAREKLTLSLSLSLCCHCLLIIQLWAWKLCAPKVNKFELCQLTLLHVERMWQNCSQTLTIQTVRRILSSERSWLTVCLLHPPVNNQLDWGVKERTRLPRIFRAHEGTVTSSSKHTSKFAFITHWVVSPSINYCYYFCLFCLSNNLLHTCRFCITYILLVVTWTFISSACL
jgi:hypothetical protein